MVLLGLFGHLTDAHLEMDSSGNLNLRIYDGGAVDVRSSSFYRIPSSGWYLCQLTADWSTGTHRVKAKVNGVASSELTVSSTSSSGTCGYFGNYFADNAAGPYIVNYDGYVLNEGYAFYGPYSVIGLRPNADIDTTWTITGAGGSRWNSTDNTTPDETQYISSATSGSVQRLDLTTTTLGNDVPAAAHAHILWGTSTTGSRSTFALQNSAGNDSVSITPTISFTFPTLPDFAELLVVTPPSGSSWDQTFIDGMRFKATHAADTNTNYVLEVLVDVVLTIGPVKQALTASLSFTGPATNGLWRQVGAATKWAVKRRRLRRR